MDLAHVGVIVPNLEAGRDRLSEFVGVEWGPVSEARVLAVNGASRQWVTLRVCFSTGAPGIELLEEVPGTVWVCNEHSNLHHVSFFADELVRESDRLDAARCPLEYAIVSGEGPPILAYHRDALGVRIELVSSAVRSNIEQHRSPGEPT
jgi:hypothetical protein